MNLSARAFSARPHTACEVTPEGVVAARSLDSAEPLSAAAHVTLPPGAVLPSLKPGNLADRVVVIAAIRRALEGVGARPNSRGSDLTLILPDGAARVLLLDFDTLPTKLTEALPIVRFRLKKLLPFEADDAMVSYQVMSSSRTLLRVLAVAIPRDVLAEYETAVREAGFEPGAVLPSTLAALPIVPGDEPVLLINGSWLGVTTAIVNGEALLLHRTVDLQGAPAPLPANVPTGIFDGVAPPFATGASPAQEAEYGQNAYKDHRLTEEAVQGRYDGITGLPAAQVFGETDTLQSTGAEGAHSIMVTPTSLRSLAASEAELTAFAERALAAEPRSRLDGEGPAGTLEAHATGVFPQAPREPLEEDVAQAVSVAMAYFEDTLSREPRQIWSTGSMSANSVAHLLRRRGLLDLTGLDVRELVNESLLQGSAISAAVPRHVLAGVAGALRG